MIEITGDCRTEGGLVLGKLLAALSAAQVVVTDLTSGPGRCDVTDSGQVWTDGDGVMTMPLVTCQKQHGLSGESVVVKDGLYEGVTYSSQPLEGRPSEFYLLGSYSGDAPGCVWEAAD